MSLPNRTEALTVALHNLPTVSIVIPAKNEEAVIGTVLERVFAVDYPSHRVEVVVVDNGSSDGTRRIAKSSGARVLCDADGTVGALRNLGAKKSSGEILAFLDADCVPAPGWLKAVAGTLEDGSVGAVGGACIAPSMGTWVERAWANHTLPERQEVDRLATSTMALRREIFEGIGGFDPALGAGEDDDLSNRLRREGFQLYSIPECEVIHLGYPTSLAGVARRQVWHGRNQLDVASPMDPLVLLTHGFAATVILLLMGMVIPVIAVIGLGIVHLLIPTVAAVRRSRGVKHAAQLIPIFWAFFIGRSFGLVLNYWDRIRAKWGGALFRRTQ